MQSVSYLFCCLLWYCLLAINNLKVLSTDKLSQPDQSWVNTLWILKFLCSCLKCEGPMEILSMKVLTGFGSIYDCMVCKHIKSMSGCHRGQWLPGASLALGWPWAPTAKPPAGWMHLEPIYRVPWKLHLKQLSLQQILLKQCYTAAVF